MTITRLCAAGLLACAACGGEPREARDPGIRVTHLVTLGDTAGEGALIGMPASIARDSRGRYFTAVNSGAASELVAVFDSTGRFLERIGAIGSGPGEYELPNVVLVTPDDSVWILDVRSRRLNILAPDLTWVESTPLPAFISNTVRFPDDSYLVNWPMPGPDSTSVFLRRFDRAGNLLAAYEEPRAACAADCFFVGMLVFAADSAGGAWAARSLGELEVSRYDSAGRLVRRMDLDAPWFPHHDPGPYPAEMMLGITLDDDGRIWLAARTTAASGAPDGILEVRDSTTGAVLATRRFDDDPLLLPFAPGLVASIGQHEDGWARVEIWEVAFEEGTAR